MRCHTSKRRYGDKTETVPWEIGRRESAEFLSPDESRRWYKLFKRRPRDADAEVSFAQAHNNSIPNKKLFVSPWKRFCDSSPSAHCMEDAAVLSVAETELQGIYVVSRTQTARRIEDSEDMVIKRLVSSRKLGEFFFRWVGPGNTSCIVGTRSSAQHPRFAPGAGKDGY